ncbi:MAG: hypothetical protein NC314_07850 [Roseburia sp.]|nr:hypothetical protein [Roseburia sp.]
MKLESLNDISNRIVLFKDMIKNKFSENKEISNDTPVKYTEEIIEKMPVPGYRKRETASDVEECLKELLI